MEGTFKFKKGEKVKIISKAAALKKYAKETGEVHDYGYAKAGTIPGVAKSIPKETQLRIYQVKRDKNGFLVTIPESGLSALKK